MTENLAKEAPIEKKTKTTDISIIRPIVTKELINHSFNK